MFQIDKTFEFCYGHRVHSQVLDSRYADDLKCACRHLHGHEAKVQVFMEAETLNDQGMVVDFRHTEWLKRALNEHVDHKFLIDAEDPLRSALMLGFAADTAESVYVQVGDVSLPLGARVKASCYTHLPLAQQELLAGFLVVPFVPTSENLAKWVYELTARAMAPIGVNVTRVDWWETPKSRSSYQVGPTTPH